MSWVEITGFIISFIAMVYLLFKNQTQGSRGQEGETNDELSENDPMTSFIRDLQKEIEKKEGKNLPKKPPQAPPIRRDVIQSSPGSLTVKKAKEKQKSTFSSSHYQVKKEPYALSPVREIDKKTMADKGSTKGVKDHLIDEKRTQERSRAAGLLKKPSDLSHAILLREILDKPKGW